MTSRSVGEMERRGTTVKSSARFLPENLSQEVWQQCGSTPTLSEAVTQQQQWPLFLNYGRRVRIRKSLSLTFRSSGDSSHVCVRPCMCVSVCACLRAFVSVPSRRIAAAKAVWLPVILCSRFSRHWRSSLLLFTIQDTLSLCVAQSWQKRHTSTHSVARRRTHKLFTWWQTQIIRPLFPLYR